MKRIFVILTILVCYFGHSETFAITKPKDSKMVECLEYDVFYHWGIIWKKAGHGYLNLYEEIADNDSKRMHGQVTGKTLSFIEYIMAVRDTLDCWYTPEYVPIEFCKKTNEGSYKAIERNYYSPTFKTSGTKAEDVESTVVDIHRWRNKKGNDTKKFTTKGAAYDMLSIFYMMRGLDYSKLKPGTTLKYPVFAGIKMQWLTVKYVEETSCKLRNGTRYPAYKVELAFNVKGEDGVPMVVWVSKEKDHRPLSIVIQLKRIGAIQCEIVE